MADESSIKSVNKVFYSLIRWKTCSFYFQGGSFPGGNFPGGTFPGGTFPRTVHSICILFYFNFLVEMSHILHTGTVHKTESLSDEGNSAYCQARGAHNIKHT